MNWAAVSPPCPATATSASTAEGVAGDRDDDLLPRIVDSCESLGFIAGVPELARIPLAALVRDQAAKLGRNEDWERTQIRLFKTLAGSYRVPSTR